MSEPAHVRSALTRATHDQLVYDLTGIERQYHALLDELPDVSVRFAVKACPHPAVLACLARVGAGFDAASPGEIELTLRNGALPDDVHYGNTVKSDRNLADFRLPVQYVLRPSLNFRGFAGTIASGLLRKGRKHTRRRGIEKADNRSFGKHFER